MTPTPDKKPRLSPLETFTHPPTKPGWYWFKDPLAVYAVMVEVQEIDGQLMVYLLQKHQPVADLTGTWQGPLATAPVSQRTHETKGLPPKGK
ncbi:MAG TPA: hypothetical protein VEI50_03460 [Nitrospiraceae bacterium]|nr:hypothetical protein [Nitrospiraceae bacterium]